MTTVLDPARWSRRRFLAVTGVTAVAAVASVGGLAACSGSAGTSAGQQAGESGSGPDGRSAPDGRGPDRGQPPEPAVTGATAGASIEDALAAHASTVLLVGADQLGGAARRLVTAIRNQHAAHAAALRSTDPTDPGSADAAVPEPNPSPTGSVSAKEPSFASAVDRLLTAESEAAVAHRTNALAGGGLPALLWGSLATSAAALAAILKAADLAGDDPDPAIHSVAAVAARAPMPVVPVAAAEQEMVRQLHAIIYGYQLALGRLTGRRRDNAAAELRRHRILRDRLTARLLARDAEVPVADAAYVPSTNPRDAASAGKLIRQLETALTPFCGLWLAAAETTPERTEALGQLGRTDAVARQWGGTLPAWPGWKSG